MKLLTIVLTCFLFALSALAHEGDEEFEVKDSPKFGGRVASIMREDKNHTKHHSKVESHHHDDGHKDHHAKEEDHHDDDVVLKAEILISDDNTIRLYIFDKDMKAIPLADFPSQLKGVIKQGMGKRKKQAGEVNLAKDKNYFLGNIQRNDKKPFDLSFSFKYKNDDLVLNYNFLD